MGLTIRVIWRVVSRIPRLHVVCKQALTPEFGTQTEHPAITGHGAGQVAKRLGHSSARVTQSLYEHLHQGEQTAMSGLYDRLTGYPETKEDGKADPST